MKMMAFGLCGLALLGWLVWRTQHPTREIKYTLVAGDQMAPFGPDGAMMLVHAELDHSAYVADASGKITQHLTSLCVSPVHQHLADDSYWSSCYTPGDLPAQMTNTIYLPYRQWWRPWHVVHTKN